MVQPWLPAECDEDELVEFLEPDQLAASAARPVLPARLSPRAEAGLWALRLVALVVGAMVIYTFVYQTIHAGH